MGESKEWRGMGAIVRRSPFFHPKGSCWGTGVDRGEVDGGEVDGGEVDRGKVDGEKRACYLLKG